MQMKKYLAEMVGTAVLVLMGCGVAVSLSCGTDTASVVGTAMAFGLAVVAMAYTIGGVSGCHINPAITLGVFLSKRMSGKDAIYYIIFQCIGAFIGSALLYALTTNAGLTGTGANDLQEGVSTLGGLLAEIIFTTVFVLVVLGQQMRRKVLAILPGWQSVSVWFWFIWYASATRVPVSTQLVLWLLQYSKVAPHWPTCGFLL